MTLTLRVRDRVGRFAVLAFYVVSYSAQVVRVVQASQATGRLTGLVYAGTASLMLYFTLKRRPARALTSSWGARLAAFLGTFGGLAFRPGGVPLAPGPLTVALTAAGTAISAIGILALGRSFGVVAAHRGIIGHGMYRWIRHPLYAGYMLSHVGFVLAYPTRWNALVWLVADGSQLLRIRYEERLLSQDAAYAAYQRQVRWRLIPGVF